MLCSLTSISPLQSANISKALKNASSSMRLYANSPRMIPSHLPLPRLNVMNLSVGKAHQNLDDGRGRSSVNNEPKVNMLVKIISTLLLFLFIIIHLEKGQFVEL